MTAREAILARLRQGVGRADAPGRRAAAEAILRAPVRGPQPAVDGDLVARFVARAEILASSVAQVGEWTSAPSAVAAYLTTHGLGTQAVMSPALAGLDWSAAGLDVAARAAVDADTVGITGCFCAIAETGTLLLLSGAETPSTVSLLPETHIALVEAARIVPTMEAAFALLRSEHGQVPRAVNFVSGPSRTGDIEQTIVLGAHGPRRVHLILIGETA